MNLAIVGCCSSYVYCNTVTCTGSVGAGVYIKEDYDTCCFFAMHFIPMSEGCAACIDLLPIVSVLVLRIPSPRQFKLHEITNWNYSCHLSK